MNTQLLLIRHGDVVYVDETGTPRPELIYNGDTAQLTEMGRSQLESLGRTLRIEGISPDMIISSDYQRAIDSATALVRGMKNNINIQEQKILRDVYAPNWDGISKEEFIRLTNGDIYSFAPQTPEQSFYIKDQESIADIITRQRRMQYAFNLRKGSRIGIVGHGDQLSALHWAMSHDEGELPEGYWQMKELFYLEKAEAHLLTLDPSLRIVGEGRRIRIPEVDASIEGWRNQRPEKE